MRGGFALRVLPFEFGTLVNAFETGLANLLGFFRVYMALEPDKIFIFVGQFFIELGQRQLQQLGE